MSYKDDLKKKIKGLFVESINEAPIPNIGGDLSGAADSLGAPEAPAMPAQAAPDAMAAPAKPEKDYHLDSAAQVYIGSPDQFISDVTAKVQSLASNPEEYSQWVKSFSTNTGLNDLAKSRQANGDEGAADVDGDGLGADDDLGGLVDDPAAVPPEEAPAEAPPEEPADDEVDLADI